MGPYLARISRFAQEEDPEILHQAIDQLQNHNRALATKISELLQELAEAKDDSGFQQLRIAALEESLPELTKAIFGPSTERGRLSPVATLRALTHDLVEQRHPLARMKAVVTGFWKVVAESPALRARTRELSEELERDLGRMLAASVDAPAGDPAARLIAAVLVGAWRVAFREALRRQRSARAATVRDVFLQLLDRGFAAAGAAARVTPYG